MIVIAVGAGHTPGAGAGIVGEGGARRSKGDEACRLKNRLGSRDTLWSEREGLETRKEPVSDIVRKCGCSGCLAFSGGL
jgi:hypothetical protein